MRRHLWLALALVCLGTAADPCFAQAPGTTVSIIGFVDRTATNISVTGNALNYWMALEVNTLANATQHGMDLWRYDSTTGTVYAKANIQAYSDLTNDGMYPSIVTWSGAVDVMLVSKEDVFQPEAHLRVYEQDRDDFTQGPIFGPVTTLTTGFDHSKPHIARENLAADEFLCWTRKLTGGSDDVWSKVNDGSTWLNGTDHTVSANPSETEDHCMQAFHVDGKRYLVYHHDIAGGDDIWLKITSWSGGTWSNVADFALTGSAGADFPTIWVRNMTTMSQVLIAAKSGGNNPLVWECTGLATACDSAAEFGGATTALTGMSRFDPKIFSVPRGGFVDTFLVYQNQGTPHRVRIAKKCASAGWQDVGPLPLPTLFPPYNAQTDTDLGVEVSSSEPSIYWDGGEFWVSFLAEDPANNAIYEPMLYHASPSLFCP